MSRSSIDKILYLDVIAQGKNIIEWHDANSISLLIKNKINQDKVSLGVRYFDGNRVRDGLIKAWAQAMVDSPETFGEDFPLFKISKRFSKDFSSIPVVITTPPLDEEWGRNIFFGQLTCDKEMCQNFTQVTAKQQTIQRQQKEQLLEEELALWLTANNIQVERQVSTQKHRLDLWIPGKLMLELKAAKVTGEDVCQAIDYYATYQKPIVLVGQTIHPMASRGIQAANKLIGSDEISFVTWGAVKPYVKGMVM